VAWDLETKVAWGLERGDTTVAENSSPLDSAQWELLADAGGRRDATCRDRVIKNSNRNSERPPRCEYGLRPLVSPSAPPRWH